MAAYEISKSSFGSDVFSFKDDKSRNAVAGLVNQQQKNKLRFNETAQGSFNGLSFAVNDDGTVTVSGTKTTASNTAYAYLYFDGVKADIDALCDGNHVLSGCPAGGGDTTYRLYVIKSGYAHYDTGSGVVLSDTSSTGITVVVWIAAGFTITSPLVFKPMICSIADFEVDKTFVKYNEHEDVQNEALIQVIDSGVKNHCKTANGSNPSGQSYIELPVSVPAGKWIVSFTSVTSTDTDANWCRGRFHDSSGNGVSSYFSVGRGSAIYAVVTTTGESASIRINPSDTVAHSSGDTITVQGAMVCTPIAYKISPAFVPYAPSLQEMWEAIQALQA